MNPIHISKCSIPCRFDSHLYYKTKNKQKLTVNIWYQNFENSGMFAHVQSTRAGPVCWFCLRMELKTKDQIGKGKEGVRHCDFNMQSGQNGKMKLNFITGNIESKCSNQVFNGKITGWKFDKRSTSTMASCLLVLRPWKQNNCVLLQCGGIPLGKTLIICGITSPSTETLEAK